MTRTILENPTKELHLYLPKDTIEALEETNQNIIEQAKKEGRELKPNELVNIPEKVVLLLVEPSFREKYRFDREKKAATDYVAWFTSLLMRRAAPDTDERVIRELIHDMSESAMANLTHAYLTGELPDPKVVGQVVRQTLTGMTGSLLSSLAREIGRS